MEIFDLFLIIKKKTSVLWFIRLCKVFACKLWKKSLVAYIIKTFCCCYRETRHVFHRVFICSGSVRSFPTFFRAPVARSRSHSRRSWQTRGRVRTAFSTTGSSPQTLSYNAVVGFVCCTYAERYVRNLCTPSVHSREPAAKLAQIAFILCYDESPCYPWRESWSDLEALPNHEASIRPATIYVGIQVFLFFYFFSKRKTIKKKSSSTSLTPNSKFFKYPKYPERHFYNSLSTIIDNYHFTK